MEYEVAQERVKALYDTIDQGKYPETYIVLEEFVNDWYDCLSDFQTNVLNSDKKYPIESRLARLIEEILLDEIANNDDNAMCDLGSLYYTGRIGVRDYQKAVMYYEMSAKLGNRQAQENLGYCYYYGRVDKPDYKKAYHCFVKGALDDHIISLYKIGDMYKNGLYVEKDEKEAFSIFEHCLKIMDEEQCREFGSDVYIRLADCYFNGLGTEQNLNAALEGYQKAELLYFPRICDGDFMCKKQYERAISMQQVVREKMKESLPDYIWTKDK